MASLSYYQLLRFLNFTKKIWSFILSRIIRRYPNRRLYDTVESRYVSLEDLKRLVLCAIPFKVLDSKTSEDASRSVLLQILLDQESQATPLLSDALIRSFICAYSHPLGATLIAPYLEKSLEALQANYQQWTQHLSPEQLTPQAWQQWWQQHLHSWLNPINKTTTVHSDSWNPWSAWWSTFSEKSSTKESLPNTPSSTSKK